MLLETAQRIKQSADDIGLEIEIHEDYSGRGMYGKRTTGLVGSITDIIAATADAAYRLGRDDDASGDTFLEDLNWSQDNMGRDLIMY